MDHSLINNRFIAQLVHDMRTPLSVIAGFIETVRAECPDLVEFKEAALRSLTKLQRLVELLVAPSTEIAPRCKWTDLSELTRLTVKELRIVTRPGNVDILYVGAERALAFVDPLLINRVLVNFIINSFHAIEKESGTIRVGLFLNDDNFLLEVCDNGTGIENEHMERIFEPGFSNGKTGGSGLGLDICRQIVAAHRGKIDIYSVPGRGAVFTATIPHSSATCHDRTEQCSLAADHTID